MKAADLRKSILQAAVQGKLVPQNPHDEPATTLLERIRKEKAQLVKEGKIKKEKPLPSISEDEIPFDLPEGWVWCRLGDVCIKLTDGSHNPPPARSSGYPVISAKNVKGGKVVFTPSDRFTDHIGFLKENPRTNITSGDIVLGIIGGSIGNVGIFDHEVKVIAQRSIAIINTLNINAFVYCFIQSPHVQSLFGEKSSGTAQGGVYLGELKSIPLPLPPQGEQKAITEKVNELMVLCDELEAAEKELDTLESNFAEYLPKSILQAAVQGKLVPQNIHDEPADKLLERIKAEKAKLVKNGKLKKEKPLPPITEDEIPYDLPDGWIWCRLGEVIEKNTGGGTPSKQKSNYWGGDIPWASVKDMNVEYITKTEDSITIKGLENSSTSLIEEGSIIVCTRMGLGKIAVNTIPLAINQDLRALRLSAFIDKQYFILAYKTFAITGSGMTVKGIKIDELHSFLLPLPPLAEQQRIVAKVNELIALCGALKAAHEAPVGNLTVAKVIPFPQPEDEPEILMAARGKMPKAPSKALQDARNRLLED